MKLFFYRWLALGLALATGFLGFQTWELRRRVADLRDTVALLEQERRELVRQAATPVVEKPEQRAELRQEIERQTSALRGLAFRGPVTYKMISRSELRDVLIRQVREQHTEQEARAYGRCFEALGVIPPGTDLMALFIRLYDEQVGAFYIPQERALYTFQDMSLSAGMDRMILAHELTHALQDQHYDLTKFPLHVKDNDDLALATSALLEGDATVLMTQFYARSAAEGGMWKDLLVMLTAQKTEKLQAAPPFLRELMLFPYQEGQKFVFALQLEGGDEALDRAFRNPPVSTEQILHPEKFWGERDDPRPVTVPVISSPAWQRIGSNVLGELGIRAMLATQLRFTEAQAAAAGWDGDRYEVYERGAGGPLGLVWLSVWDQEQDAEEFAALYRQFAAQRGVNAQVTQKGVEVKVVQSDEDEFFALVP